MKNCRINSSKHDVYVLYLLVCWINCCRSVLAQCWFRVPSGPIAIFMFFPSLCLVRSGASSSTIGGVWLLLVVFSLLGLTRAVTHSLTHWPSPAGTHPHNHTPTQSHTHTITHAHTQNLYVLTLFSIKWQIFFPTEYFYGFRSPHSDLSQNRGGSLTGWAF
jgi:hypothetical protein